MDITAEKFNELVGRIQNGDLEALREAQPLFRQMMTGRSGLKYPDPEVHDPESRERIQEYLDGAIIYWRTYRDVTQPGSDYADPAQYSEARIYVDAFQCVRASLLGETLEDNGLRATAMFAPAGLMRGAEPVTE